MKTMQLSAVLALVLAFVAQAAPTFPCGTFTITGSAKNWKNVLYTAENDVLVQAVSANGTVLAETWVKTAADGGDGRNFALRVPLSTVATAVTAKVGDVVTIRLTEGGVTYDAESKVKISGADAWAVVALKAVKGVELPSEGKYAVDGKVVVASSYLDGIGDWLDYYGYLAYDPDADYDNDGADNYSEYLAATNPFDASDRLKITSLAKLPDRVQLRFEYAGGVVYGVGSTTNLTTNAWTQAAFAQTREQVPTQRQMLISNDQDPEEVGVAEIYLVPSADSPAEFYRVNVQTERSVE